MEKMTILAVDDNVINLATLEQELKDKYNVVPINSGRRAIKFIQKQKVDLVLLDVEMPVMDGIETLREMRETENGTTVPVMFLTVKKDKTTVLEGSKLGIMDYVLKPFETADLHDRIEKALKRRGALPMDNEEVYKRLEDVMSAVKNENTKVAVTEMTEMQGYLLEENIAVRVQVICEKLKQNDLALAGRMIERLMQMLKQSGVAQPEEKPPISLGELNSRLLYILDDLEHFNVEDAAEKLDDLLEYQIPDATLETCMSARERLKEYDDGEAEILIREALKEL